MVAQAKGLVHLALALQVLPVVAPVQAVHPVAPRAQVAHQVQAALHRAAVHQVQVALRVLAIWVTIQKLNIIGS